MSERMRKMIVSDIMSRNVKFISEDASLLDAVFKMKEFGVSSLIVQKNDPSDAFGIVTRKDLINKLIDPERGEEHLLVGDVMTKPIITVPPNVRVPVCVKLMKRSNIRRVPVFDGKEVVGIISNSDIFTRFYPGPDIS